MNVIRMYRLWNHVSVSIEGNKLSTIRVRNYARQVHANLCANRDFCPYCGKKITPKKVR